MKSRKVFFMIAALMIGAVVSLTGCKPNSDDALIKSGKENCVTYGLGNFTARYQQSMYDQYLVAYYGEDMWSQDMSGAGKTLEEETKDGVIDDLEEMYLCKKNAADYKVELSEKEQKAIDKAVDDFIKANDKETLETMTATKEVVKEYLENRTYQNKVEKAVKEAAEVSIPDKDCWERTFSYVKFDTQKSESSEDESGKETEIKVPTKEEIAEMKNKAKAISSAEDFESACKENGIDIQTYSYLKGEKEDSTFDMSLIKAAEKLKEKKISKVIEVEGDGIYVLRLDSDHDKDASANMRMQLKSNKEDEEYTKVLEAWKEKANFKVDEKLWNQVEFDNLFKAPEAKAEDAVETDAGTDSNSGSESEADTKEESEAE